MNITDYHADTKHASKSALDILARSPAEYWYRKVLTPSIRPQHVPPHVLQQWSAANEKRHFVVGDSLDRLLLEPDKFHEDFYVGTAHSLATTAGKLEAAQLRADNPGARWLSPDEFRDVQAMARAILASPFASLVKRRKHAQQTVTWTCPDTGILCKCRPDFQVDLDTRTPSDPSQDLRLRTHDGLVVDELVVDVKTLDGILTFAKHAAEFRYDVQDSFYTDGLNQADAEAGRAPKVREFAFLIVDTNWPHPVQLHVLPPEAKAIGRQRYQRDLETLAECRMLDVWPTLDGEGVQTTEMPRWYLFQNLNRGG